MAEQFESITGAFSERASATQPAGVKTMLSFPDPMRDRRASGAGLLSYNELPQHGYVQGPDVSKPESYPRHYLFGIRQGRLRIQRVRLCLQ
jgi:hypothetical protein